MVPNKYLIYNMINSVKLHFLILQESLIECTVLCRHMRYKVGLYRMAIEDTGIFNSIVTFKVSTSTYVNVVRIISF